MIFKLLGSLPKCRLISSLLAPAVLFLSPQTKQTAEASSVCGWISHSHLKHTSHTAYYIPAYEKPPAFIWKKPLSCEGFEFLAFLQLSKTRSPKSFTSVISETCSSFKIAPIHQPRSAMAGLSLNKSFRNLLNFLCSLKWWRSHSNVKHTRSDLVNALCHRDAPNTRK